MFFGKWTWKGLSIGKRTNTVLEGREAVENHWNKFMDESSDERHSLFYGFTTCPAKDRLDAFTIELSLKLIQLASGVEGGLRK